MMLDAGSWILDFKRLQSFFNPTSIILYLAAYGANVIRNNWLLILFEIWIL